MDALRRRLVEIAMESRPCSVRQVFYAAVSEGLVEKAEGEYRNTVSRLLAEARESGTLSWSVIADHTRSVYQKAAWDGLRDVITAVHQQYRRSIWSSQPRRVEVWTEARTLMGALRPVSDEWGVPLFPCGGYPSRTFVHDAAEDIGLAGKATTVLYLGDWDPSGKDIERSVIEGLRRYAPDADITLHRLAVTPGQVAHLGLPERPPKGSDPRAKGFKGGCVEVEALPAPVIRSLVAEAIEGLVDRHELAVVKAAEESERDALEAFSYGRWHEGSKRAYALDAAGE